MQTREEEKNAYERMQSELFVRTKFRSKNTQVITIFSLGDCTYLFTRRGLRPTHVCRKPETEDHIAFIWCERSSTRSTHHLSFPSQFYLLNKRWPTKNKWSNEKKEFAYLLHLHHILGTACPLWVRLRRVHTMDSATNKPIASIYQCK